MIALDHRCIPIHIVYAGTFAPNKRCQSCGLTSSESIIEREENLEIGKSTSSIVFIHSTSEHAISAR